MKKVIVLLLIVAVGLIFLTRNKSDDDFFNSYFNQMVEAGETKNHDQFMSFFSLQYQDEYGLNYIIINELVKNTFNEFGTLEGSFSDLSSKIEEIDGKSLAIVNMDVNAIGIKNGIDTGILGLSNDPENITIYLEKSTLGKWKIIKVEGLNRSDY
ncbi:MAG: hypothetical protein ACR2NW_02110 [Thermodesulfobacteriota bacterium]